MALGSPWDAPGDGSERSPDRSQVARTLSRHTASEGYAQVPQAAEGDRGKVHYHIRINLPLCLGLCALLLVPALGGAALLSTTRRTPEPASRDLKARPTATPGLRSQALNRLGGGDKGQRSVKRTEGPLFGVGYSPVPPRRARLVKGHHQDALPLQYDVMAPDASAFWGSDGRGDLEAIKSLGANAVRTYGSNPDLDHRPFLDEARRVGLDVVATLPSDPFLKPKTGCVHKRQNCYAEVKDAYLRSLKSGFLGSSGEYHPALRTVIIMSEPENVFLPTEAPWLFCKAMLSAFDGVLDAEKEAGLESGPLPDFSVSFSFAECPWCLRSGDVPAVGRMAELASAMRHPSSVSYRPRNDLWAAYRARFENSFAVNASAGLPLEGVLPQIGSMLAEYERSDFEAPVFISEFAASSAARLGETLQDLAARSKVGAGLLSGASVLQFQAAPDPAPHGAGGLGIFEVAGGEIDTVSLLPESGSDREEFRVRCLVPAKAHGAARSVAAVVAGALGGSVPESHGDQCPTAEASEAADEPVEDEEEPARSPPELLGRLLAAGAPHRLHRGGTSRAR